MLILGIDSSTKAGTASLLADNKVIGEKLLNLDQTHSQRLMPQIVDLMDSCGCCPDDLTGIGVAKGPGSFTGTRIGLATAKTLAQSLEVSIVGVSTLKVLAYGFKYIDGYVCSLIDARGGRVFACLYQAGGKLVPQTEEAILTIEKLLDKIEGTEEKVYFVGKIAAEYKSEIEARISQARFGTSLFNLPRAGAVAELAAKKLESENSDNLFALTPNYLKRSQAEIQWEQNQD